MIPIPAVKGAAGATGTSPQVIFKVQASLDGINWFDVGRRGHLDWCGTGRIEFSAVEPFHQVVWTVSGTTPSFTGVNSHLVYLK